MLLPFVGNAFVELPLGHRFVLLAIVYLHIGLVWLLLRLTPGHAGAFRFLRAPRLGHRQRAVGRHDAADIFDAQRAGGSGAVRQIRASATGRESP